jgi:TRAP-type C4-dicarboxylate transport system substrate-binding protein
MKKLVNVILVVVLSCTVVASWGCAKAGPSGETEAPPKAEPVVLRLCHDQTPDSLYGQIGHRFAEIAAEQSDGLIQVESFGIGELYEKNSEMIKACQTGTTDFDIVALDNYATSIPQVGVFVLPGLSLAPGLKFDPQYCLFMMNAPELGGKIEEIMNAQGLTTITSFPKDGGTQIYNFEAKGLADVKGKAMRTAPAKPHQDYVEKGLEMQWVSLASSEVYTALQQGLVDAVSTSWDAPYRLHWYEVAPYTVTNAGHQGIMVLLSMGLPSWNKLSQGNQQILMGKIKPALEDYIYNEQLPVYLAKCRSDLESVGATFIEWSDADVEELESRLLPTWEAYRADYGDLVDAALKVREDYLALNR